MFHSFGAAKHWNEEPLLAGGRDVEAVPGVGPVGLGTGLPPYRPMSTGNLVETLTVSFTGLRAVIIVPELMDPAIAHITRLDPWGHAERQLGFVVVTF